MIPQTFEYTAPKTLDEALALLAAGAKPLAGGMSLIPMMKLRLAAPDHLVDLGRLKDLNYIREAGRRAAHRRDRHASRSRKLRAGARRSARCWPRPRRTSATCRCAIMGTIGGSVAHADPSADYPAALQALEAKLVLQGAKSERTVASRRISSSTPSPPRSSRARSMREVIVPVEGRSSTDWHQLSEGRAAGQRIRGRRHRGAHATRGREDRHGAHRRHRPFESRLSRHRSGEGARRQAPDRRPRSRPPRRWWRKGVDANSDLHASADYRTHLARGVRGARAGYGARARAA